MASVNQEFNSVVVRIVYAGPPLAGKSESVRSLAGLLLGKRAEDAVFSPGEAEGRTLYFDWVRYTGGLFKGRRVHCQIVSVPGQKALAARRKLILETADAVVFVLDSSPQEIEAARSYLEELKPWLARPQGEPPVGVMVQANKRDLPEAVPVAEIRRRLGDDPNTGVVATTATLGTGIRESFVMAVGLSLERVQSLMDGGRLPACPAQLDEGQRLLRRIEGSEGGEDSVAVATEWSDSSREPATIGEAYVTVTRAAAYAPAVEPERESVARAADMPESEAPSPAHQEVHEEPPPALPDGGLPAGSVWPPIAGRIILNELDGDTEVQRRASGTWWASVGKRWCLASAPEDVFDDMEAGRRTLLDFARAHKSWQSLVTEHRCMALAPANSKHWRLWQIVRREKNLAVALRSALRRKDPRRVANDVCGIALFYLLAVRLFRENASGLPVSLSYIGWSDDRPVYTGMLPTFLLNGKMTPSSALAPTSELLRREFSRPVAKALEESDMDVPALLHHLRKLRPIRADSDVVVDILSALFIGH
ncbi:MAG: GTPase domain-containing protein [Gammaproteobacteria bacterium]|nr:GTPase domain-containing protein [Gammaproteobacteria bacterium]NIR82768.1 GTPase domain-containing protein [Gammaproteobacteria bacterium]NIR89632.1 GTPase domain-containing protein [Gammaproteobacteria bacterium]NIU03928.1 GTPase domain-containing protein [Gammaproteobacteria bacterium]NIV51244.1 hypothetical protein [Gammaproteobacteria bacterium]